jgi:murein DD-endopeptidase MepM/ murein hydrolase activator NlpD
VLVSLAALWALPGAAPASVSGGAQSAPRATVDTVSCRSSCTRSGARPGGLLRLRGRNLENARQIVFLGGRGPADDVRAPAARPKARTVDVRVPAGAKRGRVRVIDARGRRGRVSRRTVTIAAPAVPQAESGVPKVFFDAASPARFDYVVPGDQPLDVAIVLLRAADDASIASWRPGVVAPGSTQTVTWDGRAGERVQREGRYRFVVYATPPGAGPPAGTASAGAPEPQPAAAQDFVFLSHRFPVRGTWNFGGFAASFGGGRGHKGQDVFARCGTPLVAARGGTVKFKAFHARAGHYIVIDGEATGVDYAYMHLRSASPLSKGDRVRTGQVIGEVGDTGRATGCHLHFEMWSAPGWFSGGEAMDPLPSLSAWARSGG